MRAGRLPPPEGLTRTACPPGPARLPCRRRGLRPPSRPAQVGADGFRLLDALYRAGAPADAASLPEVAVLRRVWARHLERDKAEADGGSAGQQAGGRPTAMNANRLVAEGSKRVMSPTVYFDEASGSELSPLPATLRHECGPRQSSEASAGHRKGREVNSRTQLSEVCVHAPCRQIAISSAPRCTPFTRAQPPNQTRRRGRRGSKYRPAHLSRWLRFCAKSAA